MEAPFMGAKTVVGHFLRHFLPTIYTGARAKVKEFESKRIWDFRPGLHISFIRLHQNTGDTSTYCIACSRYSSKRSSFTFARAPVVDMCLVQTHVDIHFGFNTCVRLCVLQDIESQPSAPNLVLADGGDEGEEGGWSGVVPEPELEPVAEGGS